MKKTLLICTLLIACTSIFGQTKSDSIVMKKVFGGYQFYQNEKILNMAQLATVFQANEQAYREFKSAKSSYTLATVIGCVGGFMVGWPIGAALGGGEANWTMAGIGAGLIVVTIPIINKFNKQAKTAVETYNGGQKTGSLLENTELRFGFTGNGIGLAMTF